MSMMLAVATRISLPDEMLQIKKLVEVVSSRSTRTPALLRLEAAQRLLEAQQTIADFLEILAMQEFSEDP